MQRSEVDTQAILEVVREGMLAAVEDDERRRARVLRMSMSTPLESLGIDSMATMEIAAYIEDELDVLLPNDGFEETHSVADLVEFVRRSLCDGRP